MESLTIDDADPDERRPAAALYVPVRLGSAGGQQLRFSRTPLGVRTAVGFTSPERLCAVLGPDQSWIRLAEPALRSLAAPLGVTTVTVDPQLAAPAPTAVRAEPVGQPCARRGNWDPDMVGVLRVTGAARGRLDRRHRDPRVRGLTEESPDGEFRGFPDDRGFRQDDREFRRMTTEPDFLVRELSSPSVWPDSAVNAPGGDVSLAGVSLAELAERHGTPVYVLDETEVRARARTWRRALPDAEIVYAAKAFVSRAVVDWMAEEGLGLDVCSAGELELAATRGFPPERVVLHGNAKSPRDLSTALRLGVGRIVIDSDSEIARIAAQVPKGAAQKVLVRVLPGIEAGAHRKVMTGAEGQKFGLSITGGDAEDAVARVLGQPGLELVGLHCHLGSQITSTEPYGEAVRRVVAFLARIRDRHGVTLPELDLGGGFAAAYLPGDPAPSPAAYGRRITEELARSCAEFSFPLPRLTVEPGRSIMAPAGVALYRVLSVKRTGAQVFVAVDGGMSDNPRPALYGAGTRSAWSAVRHRRRCAPRRWSGGTARRATSWRRTSNCRTTYAPETSSPYRRPGRTRSRWRPATT